MLSLKTLHISARYNANINDIVSNLENDFLKLFSEPMAEKKLTFLCHELFYKILLETADVNDFFNGKKNFIDTCNKISFEKNLKDNGFNAKIGKNLDAIAFKISDFAFCFGNEGQLETKNKLFGNWPYRSPQMLFMQKGQLWLLNLMNNTLKWSNGKSQEEIKNGLKDFLRKSIDLDFSPYLNILKSEEVDKMVDIVSDYGKNIKKSYQNGLNKPLNFKINNNRGLGFELECQIKSKKADILASKGKDAEKLMLNEVYNLFKKDKNTLLNKVSLDPKEVTEKGTITRDASCIRYPGCLAFEYSSPIAKNGLKELKYNTNLLCEFLEKNGGGLVREDSGTHFHVSIEDLLPAKDDSKEVAEEKLNAIKRIFINYVLLEDKIASILPFHRRKDNSWFSGQPYDTYVNNNKDFIVGMIAMAESYEDLRQALMAGGKYVSLAPFADNLEFRTFPATTNPETLNTWFEFMNDFVNNSIKGLPLEKCLNKDIFEKLQVLTKNGTFIEGKADDEGIFFTNCNKFTSPTLPKIKVNKVLEYAKNMTQASVGAGYGDDPELTDMPVSVDINRLPGERPLLANSKDIQNSNLGKSYVKGTNFVNKNINKSFLEKYLNISSKSTHGINCPAL